MSMLATLWAALVAALTAVAWLARLRLRPVPVGELPAFSLLRPCEGVDAATEAALRASFALPGAMQVVVCTPGPDDPASVLTRALMAEHPDVDARLVHDAVPAWKNPKARRLSGAWPHLRHPIVVQADADVLIDLPTLHQLLGALGDGVAATWCIPLPSGAGDGGRLLRAVMGGSFDALSVTAGLNAMLGVPPALSGALLAYRKAHLPEGYAPAADDIGDDLAVGRVLAAHGRVLACATPVTCDRRTLSRPVVRAMLRRWIRVALAPAFPRFFGFPTMIASMPTLLLTLPFAPIPSLCAAGLRLAGALAIRRELTGDRLSLRIVGDTLLAEFLVLDAAMRAAWDHLRGVDLVWCERRYQLGPGGQIRAVTEPPAR
jgi:ceramide glucosyltransferase